MESDSMGKKALESIPENSDEDPFDEWGDGKNPDCFGSYKGTIDCGSCRYREECLEISKDILRGKTQKIRYGGKYKGRGKERKRDVF